ncbi:MAG: DNA-binding Lrp family transcriptional regulator [Glaciecola sp.]|jgi:DNA-binding Lrp family transcriptional regulator
MRMTEAGTLDDIDQRLVELLVQDARRSVNELAQEVQISRASAYRRLDRLREDRVIMGFHAEVDPRALGRPLTAIIEVQAEQGAWRQLRADLQELPGLEYLAMTTGRYDFLLVLRSAGVEALRDTVLERLNSLPTVRGTETTFVLEDLRRPPGLPEAS